MKKSNTKTKSPAPATSVMKTTKKKAPAASNGVASAAALKVAPVQSGAPVNPLPALKPVATSKAQTKIVARIDAGFGNALYVRGDGPGLSWNQGAPMKCISNDHWELSLAEAARPISFKILLNDTTWCTGPDNTVESGATATVKPEFA
jgi:hypothetical protein